MSQYYLAASVLVPVSVFIFLNSHSLPSGGFSSSPATHALKRSPFCIFPIGVFLSKVNVWLKLLPFESSITLDWNCPLTCTTILSLSASGLSSRGTLILIFTVCADDPLSLPIVLKPSKGTALFPFASCKSPSLHLYFLARPVSALSTYPHAKNSSWNPAVTISSFFLSNATGIVRSTVPLGGVGMTLVIFVFAKPLAEAISLY